MLCHMQLRRRPCCHVWTCGQSLPFTTASRASTSCCKWSEAFEDAEANIVGLHMQVRTIESEMAAAQSLDVQRESARLKSHQEVRMVLC